MDILPFLIAGLTTGAVYGLTGAGLVLTYKTSGVFNFAHGALATVSAYVFYSLHVEHGMPWPAAALIAVLVVGPVVGVVLEQITRRMSQSSLSVRAVGTVGILLVVQASVTIIYGTTTQRIVPQFLPQHAFTIGSTVVTLDRIIIFVVALVATAGLWVLFRTTRIGLSMRGVVDDSSLLDIAGTNPARVRRSAWIIGVSFASASGVLLCPLIALDPTTLTLLVIQAFGAAAIGRFTSLPLTFVGGLAIGVGSSLCSKYFTSGLGAGLSATLPFIALFLVLLFSKRRWLIDRAPLIPAGRSGWRAPWTVQLGFGVALLAFLLYVPSLVSFHLGDWTQFLAMAILFLSLGLLVRTSGQVSLSHTTFLAIGVCGMSHLAVEHHWPWGLALLVAGLIAVPIGALLSIPAIRLSGLFLALATFGFGILVQYMFYTQSYMFGGFGSGLVVPRPEITIGIDLSSDKGFYYLVLAFLLASTALVVGLNHSRLGRLLRALADSPTGLATSGASINVTRVLVFCLSAFLAAIAGALSGAAQGAVTGNSYQPLLSLTLFALIIITVGGEPWYALLAAAGLTLVPSYVTGSNVSNYLTLIFGLVALAYAVTPESARGVPLGAQRLIDRLGITRSPSATTDDPRRTPTLESSRDTVGALRVSGLSVRFGGLVAVDQVDLEAPVGRITGLIGPNGAGKTTTFNACSGLNRPSSGTVSLDGRNVGHRTPSGRARMGIGRTFQQMELFETMTVRQNVALGYEAFYADLNPFAHLVSSPRRKKLTAASARDALELCDLTELAHRTVGSLSTGQRRLVELARCLAGSHHILLLDEPSSGLDRTETEQFGSILLRVMAQRRLGILLIEHDMSLVTRVCGYLYVLDFGKPVIDGPPATVMATPEVRAAYLGTTVAATDTEPGRTDDDPGRAQSSGIAHVKVTR